METKVNPQKRFDQSTQRTYWVTAIGGDFDKFFWDVWK